MNTKRSSNNDRKERKGCIVDCIIGRALVADKTKTIEHMNECEKTGCFEGKVDQNAK